MESKLNQNLSNILEIEPIPTQTELVETTPKLSGDVLDDAEFARTNIKQLLGQGQDAMAVLVNVAKDTQHPRAFEVVATLMKNMSDLNKDLMEIQKRKRDLEPKSMQDKSMNIDKAVFVGSTTELVKFLKSNKEK